MAPNNAANSSNPIMDNLRARQMVIEQSIDQWMPLPPQAPAAAADPRGTIFNFQAKNVGLIKRFIVEVSGSMTQNAAETLTKTAFSASNIFSQIILTDLNNIQRINTAGWHLAAMATARRQRVFGGAFTNDSPMLMGNNFPVNTIPSPVTTVQNFRYFYEVPVSYSDTDLRGGILAATTGANVYLQLTVNQNFVVASTGNPTTAVYISSTTDLGKITNFSITVYQNHLDQLPVDKNTNQYIVPLIDGSYSYMMINTVLTALSVNQENSIAYSNWRSFMSTFAIYDNFGSASTPGTDVAYWAIQVANSTNIIKFDPFMSALWTRTIIGDDFPAQAARSAYYFDHRTKPINTDQYGNQLFVLNPSQVQAATSQVLIGFEMMALQNNVLNATSPAKF